MTEHHAYQEVNWLVTDTGERYHALIERPEQIITLILHSLKRHSGHPDVILSCHTLETLKKMGIPTT